VGGIQVNHVPTSVLWIPWTEFRGCS